MRGKALALATSSNWIFNFALGYFVPPAFVNIEWRVYIIFGVFCTAMAVHVFFLFPETSGKTLEDVEAMFTDPSGVPYIGVPAWKTKNEYKRGVQYERGDIEVGKKFGLASEEVHEVGTEVASEAPKV